MFSTLVFIVLLGVLVLVHEFGHFIVAKRSGMRVDEFAFGFGPRIVHLFKKGGTEFNVRAFPLGGFVKIAGMEPGEEGDVENGFNSKPIYKRALVIFAGPFMSLVLGYVVLLLIGFTWGFPTERTAVDQVNPNTPAARAGLLQGDVIYTLNGKSIKDADQMVHTIYMSPGKELQIGIERDGKRMTIRATPELKDNPIYGKASKGEKDPLFQMKKVGLLGFKPGSERVRTGFISSIKRGSVETYKLVSEMLTHLFSRQVTKEVGGIVMIGYVTHQTVSMGWEYVLLELAALSLTLGIMNLLPWPILDGGHLIYLLIEKIRGKRLEPERWAVVQMTGLAVLIVLAVYLVYFDIFRIATGALPKG